MVSPLDLGLLQTFQIVFPFLFVLTAVFAVLTKLKPFGDNALYYAIIAAGLAVMTIFSTIAVKTINVMAPWFVLLFILIVFTLLAYQLVGYATDDLHTAVVTSPENASLIGWWVFALILIISIGSLTTVISEERGFTSLSGNNVTAVLTTPAGGEQASFFKVILHPKILGMAVILLVAFFAIGQLAKPSVK